MTEEFNALGLARFHEAIRIAAVQVENGRTLVDGFADLGLEIVQIGVVPVAPIFADGDDGLDFASALGLVRVEQVELDHVDDDAVDAEFLKHLQGVVLLLFCEVSSGQVAHEEQIALVAPAAQ